MAVFGEHVRFSQHFGETSRFESLDTRTQADARIDSKNIVSANTKTPASASVDSTKLTGGDSTDGVTEAIDGETDAELLQPVTIDARKLDLEQDLRLRCRNIDVEEIDNFPTGGRDHICAFGAIEVVDRTTQEDDSVIL